MDPGMMAAMRAAFRYSDDQNSGGGGGGEGGSTGGGGGGGGGGVLGMVIPGLNIIFPISTTVGQYLQEACSNFLSGFQFKGFQGLSLTTASIGNLLKIDRNADKKPQSFIWGGGKGR
ncbi:MAG: hypothetical protein AAF195_01065 [Pseudomonadota bacterium]